MAGDRTVTGYSMQPSGNAAFDAKVRAHMDTKVGRQLPPPPPKYPELGENIVRPKFGGENAACKKGGSKAASGASKDDRSDDSDVPSTTPREAEDPSPPSNTPSLEPPLEDLP